MKLKDKKLFKTKSKAELMALLPDLLKQQQEKKLKGESIAEIKYQIAVINTLCNN